MAGLAFLRLAVALAMPLACAGQARFEVASVKANSCMLHSSLDPARIELTGYPMKALLAETFKVKADQIVGPSWLDADCFTVLAKMPEGVATNQRSVMLQALLVERFKLTFHKETHLRSGYLLSLDKGGPKFKETDHDEPGVRARTGQVTFGFTAPRIKGSMTLTTFTRLLSQNLGCPLQDLTALTGTYDIDLTWAADQPGATPDSPASDPAASIFTAIRESLGLKLEAKKLPVETVVIDHLDRVPSEN